MARVQSHSLGSSSPSALIVELLEWLAARPRTYGETMEAWRTSCPRMPVWEDARDGGLIQVVQSDGGGMNGSAVRLTALGRAVLESVTKSII
jgi:hypothetical protein